MVGTGAGLPSANTLIRSCEEIIGAAGTLFSSLLSCAPLPTIDSACTQSANSSFLLRQRRLPFGTFFLIEWVPNGARIRDSEKVLPAVSYLGETILSELLTLQRLHSLVYLMSDSHK